MTDGFYFGIEFCPRLVNSHKIAAGWVCDTFFFRLFKVRIHKLDIGRISSFSEGKMTLFIQLWLYPTCMGVFSDSGQPPGK